MSAKCLSPLITEQKRLRIAGYLLKFFVQELVQESIRRRRTISALRLEPSGSAPESTLAAEVVLLYFWHRRRTEMTRDRILRHRQRRHRKLVEQRRPEH